MADWEEGREKEKDWSQPCRQWKLKCSQTFGRVLQSGGEGGQLGSEGWAWVIENTELC